MSQYTYNEAVDIAKRMGSSEPNVLIRVLQVFGLLAFKAEPKEEAIIIDITEEKSVIIKRKGKLVYSDYDNSIK